MPWVPTAEDTPYARLGGRDAVIALAQTFYDVMERDEVALAMYVTGPADYTIIVDCAGAEGLDAFIRWLKAEAGVARTESKFVLRPVSG